MKLRLVQLVIHPVLVADDGETLSPVESRPITVDAADLDAFPESFREQLAAEECRMNGPA